VSFRNRMQLLIFVINKLMAVFDGCCLFHNRSCFRILCLTDRIRQMEGKTRSVYVSYVTFRIFSHEVLEPIGSRSRNPTTATTNRS